MFCITNLAHGMLFSRFIRYSFLLIFNLIHIKILRWNDPLVLVWTNPGLIVVYVFQRACSVLYYYIYKRTAYRLSDPRFYEDSDWLRNEFERRQ